MRLSGSGEDPLQPQASGFGIERVDLELDGRDTPGHPDRAALAELLVRGHSWLLPDRYQPGRSPGPPPLFLTDDHAIAFEEDEAGPLDLDDVLEQLATAALENAESLNEDLQATGELYATLLRACLRSRWLRYHGGTLEWLSPTAVELEPGERAAAEQLAVAGQTFPLNLDSVAREVAGRSSRRLALIEVAGDQDLVITPYRVVRLSTSPTGIAELEREIERQVTRRLLSNRGLPRHDPASAVAFGFPDPWFVQAKDGTERLNPAVSELCAAISRRATEAAPGFVSDRYQIVVEALRPSQWWLTEGRRVRLSLAPRREGSQSFHLSVVGTGLAVWAAYAVEAALSVLGGMQSESWEPRRALYLIDEPERHLHPTAQVEAAAFVARLAEEGSDVVVGTHSTAFIDVPSESAALVRVWRDADGTTRGEEISGELLDRLSDDLAAAGLTVGDLLQLTRGILLVEGRHDRLVVERLCATELAASRTVVMTLRGAHETLALLDADLLRRLGKPLCVMLDSTRAAFVANLRRGEITLDRNASAEERQLAKLAMLLEHDDQDLVRPIPFDAPDIICALPAEAIRVMHPGSGFISWTDVETTGEGSGAVKRAIEKQLGVRIDIGWIDHVLAVAEEHSLQPSPVLTRAIREATAFIADAGIRGNRESYAGMP
jgi:hypothetical protein